MPVTGRTARTLFTATMLAVSVGAPPANATVLESCIGEILLNIPGGLSMEVKSEPFTQVAQCVVPVAGPSDMMPRGTGIVYGNCARATAVGVAFANDQPAYTFRTEIVGGMLFARSTRADGVPGIGVANGMGDGPDAGNCFFQPVTRVRVRGIVIWYQP